MAAHGSLLACAVCFFLIFLVEADVGMNRKLSTTLNPDCDVPECSAGVNGSFANLVYVKAIGTKDILHYALSTIGTPTVLVMRTLGLDDELKVNWTKLLSHDPEEITEAFTISNVVYSYAVVFTRLLEYNDEDDAADLTHYTDWSSTNHTFRNFTEFEWMKVSQDKNNIVFNSTVWSMETSSDMLGDSPARNYTPSLSFVFHTYSSEARETMLPHLLYNENLTQFDFTLDNFMPSFPKSRFALEVSIFSKQKNKEKMVIEETKSIDDEYTPGVFTITDLKMRPDDQQEGGFLQWKPVCYKDMPRSRSVATKVKQYDLTDVTKVKDTVDTTIVYAYFGKDLYSADVSSSATNISFGLSTDGTYTSTNFTSWTAVVGYGIPPEDKVSLLVIAVIAAGLGIPVIIIMVGGIYMCIRKRRGRSYRPLQDVSSSYPQVNA